MLQGLRIALGWESHVLLPGGEPRVLRESLVLLNHGRASCALDRWIRKEPRVLRDIVHGLL